MVRRISFRPQDDSSKINKNTVIILFVIVLVLVASAFIYLKRSNSSFSGRVAGDTKLSTKEVSTILENINKVTPIDKEEKPVITEIVNAEELKKTNPFYADAMDSDKLVVFPGSKRVIIFRASSSQIINIANLTQ